MEMTQLVCLGVSHHTATVELREYLNRAATTEMRDPAIQELAMVATCNRAELYATFPADVVDAQERMLNFLAKMHHVALDKLAGHTYFYAGADVVTHLCRVAAGLDSLVIGEPQILGQVIDAYQAAQQAQTIGPVLSLLFRTAIQAGKRARTETTISANPASISSVAVALAQQATGDLRMQRVLVVGVGEMGKLTIKALRGRGVITIDAANRTQAKAAAVVKVGQGQAYGLADLSVALAAADVVFTAVTSEQPIIDATLIHSVMTTRPERPLVLVDLAVPRNVDPAVAAVAGVRRFDVDALQANLDDALSARQRQIPQVEAIIAQEIATWEQRSHELMVEPVIVDLRQKAEAIRQRELERTLRFLGEVDPQILTHIQHLSRALVNKLLHEPTIRLKQKASDQDAAHYASTVRDIFGLEVAAEATGD
jgi:glutamyl-tRNA reductase